MFGLNINPPIRELVDFLKNRNNDIKYVERFDGYSNVHSYDIFGLDMSLVVRESHSWNHSYSEVELTSKSGHKVQLTNDEFKLLKKTVIKLYNDEKKRVERNEDISGRDEIKSLIGEK